MKFPRAARRRPPHLLKLWGLILDRPVIICRPFEAESAMLLMALNLPAPSAISPGRHIDHRRPSCGRRSARAAHGFVQGHQKNPQRTAGGGPAEECGRRHYACHSRSNLDRWLPMKPNGLFEIGGAKQQRLPQGLAQKPPAQAGGSRYRRDKFARAIRPAQS